MEKVIRNGKVAVLVSPGYGAGCYSWHSKKKLLFHPQIVELVESKKHSEITEEFCQQLLCTDEYICVLGAKDLIIQWVTEGTSFIIDEYDGSETLSIVDASYLIS